MFTAVHIVIGLAQLGLAVIGTRHVLRHRGRYAWIPLGVIYGLVYDNLVIAAGSWLGEGALLRALNVPRFVIHALLTPLLCIFAVGAARRAGLAWAQSRAVHAAVCLAATALVAWGGYWDIVRLDLVPARFFDTLRYVNHGAPPGPPLGAVITILVLVGVGALLWRRVRWPWLLLGGAVMFLAAGAGAQLVAVGNLGEIALTGALLATEILLLSAGPKLRPAAAAA
ncbi:MAG: hypothetical protein JNK29_11880 [Anaerolineales bacterium]|nr:hypothetical protein [Anaerolineales bacterium]